MSEYQKALYTRTLFDDAIGMKKEPDRVPVMSNAFTWPIVISKYKLSEVLRDYDKLFEIWYGFARDYYHDSLFDFGWRNPMRIRDVLGISGDYVFNDEEGTINHIEKHCLEVDEYDEFIADPRRFMMEKFFPRRMTNLAGSRLNAKNTFVAGMNEFAALGQYIGKLAGAVAELGVLLAGGGYLTYFDIWIHNFRGLKGTLTDLRRIPDKVQAAWEKYAPMYEFAAYDLPFRYSPPPPIPPSIDIALPLIGSGLLSRVQFGRFVWPQIKQVADKATVDGKTIMIFAEGNVEHLYEYFLQLPKGVACIQFEKDDIRKAKAILGKHCCIIGGISLELLNSGTKEQCIEETKRLVDDLAPGGGYIFSEAAMMAFKTDGRPENVRAVTEYVRMNGKY